jgi:cytoskeletal protein CcmA (bactofilin family)
MFEYKIEVGFFEVSVYNANHVYIQQEHTVFKNVSRSSSNIHSKVYLKHSDVNKK